MRLKDIESKKLLPFFMRNDEANVRLSLGIDEVIKIFDDYSGNVSTWAALDRLTESELDELAWELNIAWYEKSATIEEKREIIKNSDMVQRKLGTKWAVENVLGTYFENGIVKEWFQYSGVPGHFRIETIDMTITNENLIKFLRVLFQVKRRSAILDGIFASIESGTELHTGVAHHVSKRMSIALGMEE